VSPNSNKYKVFFSELRRRKVTRLATIYAVTGLGFIEAMDIIGGRFLIPEGVVQLVILLILIGFPIVMILGWIYDITPKGIQKTEELSSEQKAEVSSISWKPSWLTVVLFVIMVSISFAFFTVPRPNALGFKEQDWILIADLENNTQEDVFDRSLLHALSVTIDQSKRINIFPRHQALEVLKRMQMDSVEHITTPLAREIAERENIKVVLQLAISEVGGTYQLIANLLAPSTGEVVRSRQVKSSNKGEILYALDELATMILKDLGESLQKIHLRTTPLPKATTPSLEALKSLSKAKDALGRNQYGQAYEFFLKAIELDSSFAMAHAEMGMMYYNSNNRKVGEELFTKALSNLDRLTNKERLWIQALVAESRGNQEEAVRKWRVFLSEFPNSYGGWFRLGYTYMRMNRCEESIAAFTKALDIYENKDSHVYVNIASCYNLMKEYQKSIDYYLEAFKIDPDGLTARNVNNEFGFAYIKNGEIEKARDVFNIMLNRTGAVKAKGYRSMGLLSMYVGNISDAIEQFQEAILIRSSIGHKLSELRDRLYRAKMYQLKGMMHEFSTELDVANEIIRIAATEPSWYLLLGKMFVRSGEYEKAELLLEELSSRMNEGNNWDEAAYKILKGELELAKNNLEAAGELFESAIHLRNDSYSLESLANYYTVTSNLDKAISTYEEMVTLDSSLGWEAQECWVRAHFSLGKIHEINGNIEQAVYWYRHFISIWENADENLPDFMEAKSRLEELQGVVL